MTSAARSDAVSPTSPSTPKRASTSQTQNSTTSSAGGRLRSLSKTFMESSPPLGFMAATGEAAAGAPSLADIRGTSYGSRGSRRGSNSSANAPNSLIRSPTVVSTTIPEAAATSTQAPAASAATGDERNSKRKTADFADMMTGDVDGVTDNVFGRGEFTNQAYDPSKKNSIKVPEAGVLGSISDDDLEELDPRPKRKSKNLDGMFGESVGGLDGAAGSKAPGDFGEERRGSHSTDPTQETSKPVPNEDGYYPNGYHFPPKKTGWQSTAIGAKALWSFTWTPLGFFIVLYGLNVVAWGGMLFLLLCNASPYMCNAVGHPHECNYLYSPRRIWIEIDSQILNALFCVTGFGLIPWRFRDAYLLLRYRLAHDQSAMRKLAGYHRGWYRLPGSDAVPVPAAGSNHSPELDPTNETNPACPLPVKSAPDVPLTGIRAPPTSWWKMDFVIWAFVGNTFLQAVLCAFMWGFNRYQRPSWSTGLFVALACIIAAFGGWMQFKEGNAIKKVEGIPLETEELLRDAEQGTNGSAGVPVEEKKGRGAMFGKKKGAREETPS